MGTPDFAVPCLKALVQSNENVIAVYTQPDKPKGRGYKMIPTPVKKVALEYDIPVYQPVSFRKGDDAHQAVDNLKALNPDLIIAVAYGQILPESVLEIPKYKCINIHASLLPKYRGAGPIQWCILNGETVTGVTSMYMEKGLDTGDMLIKAELEIGRNETASQLHDRLAQLGADILIETIEKLKNGTLEPVSQNDEESTYAPMISKDMCRIDFSDTAQNIHNKIRGITGFAMLGGKRLKIFRSEIVKNYKSDAVCGTVIDDKKFTVVCGDGICINLLEVQAEGGKRLNVTDYLRGNRISAGICFDKES
jgi:methionyl-tRNA formyltransferase